MWIGGGGGGALTPQLMRLIDHIQLRQYQGSLPRQAACQFCAFQRSEVGKRLRSTTPIETSATDIWTAPWAAQTLPTAVGSGPPAETPIEVLNGSGDTNLRESLRQLQRLALEVVQQFKQTWMLNVSAADNQRVTNLQRDFKRKNDLRGLK